MAKAPLPQITNRASLARWLNLRGRSDGLAVAFRAVLRMIPQHWSRQTAQSDPGPLPICRCLIIAETALRAPDVDLQQACFDAFGSDAVKKLAKDDYLAVAARSLIATVSALNHAERASTVVSDSMRAAGSSLEPRLWREVTADCQALADGTDILTRPLWATGPVPDTARRTWDKVADSWQFSRTQSAFWVTWVRAHLDGQPLPVGTASAVALLDNALWEGDRAASRAEIDRITGTRTAVARAFLFDFEVHAQLLRVTGVPLDFNGMSEAEIAACLQRLRDWSENLRDWQDYAQDHARTTNEPSALLRAAGRITALIDGIGDPRHFPAGRLVTIGSDLRRLAADAGEREKVGDTLAAMLDERIDDLTALLSACFGRVLSRIEALNELELGDNEPAAVIEKVRKGLETLRTAPPDELVRLDAGATAAFAEMLRELEELEAAIEGAQGPKQVELLKRRFAQRVGGTASTLGRAVEAGRKAATKAISRFDNVVNGMQRVDTFQRLLDWLDKLF